MSEENNKEKLDKIFYTVLQIHLSDISDDLSLATLPSFDSFNILSLFTQLEKQFSVSFSSEELRESKTKKDIETHLKQKGVLL